MKGSFDFTGKIAVKTAPTGVMPCLELGASAAAPRRISRFSLPAAHTPSLRGSGLDRELLIQGPLHWRIMRGRVGLKRSSTGAALFAVKTAPTGVMPCLEHRVSAAALCRISRFPLPAANTPSLRGSGLDRELLIQGPLHWRIMRGRVGLMRSSTGAALFAVKTAPTGAMPRLVPPASATAPRRSILDQSLEANTPSLRGSGLDRERRADSVAGAS